MLKAQHASMAQQASNNLASIRNTEIQYYVGFFNNIGIQSAFIAGYQLSTISQVPIGTNSIYFAYCYWISSVISICCSLECLLVSLYLVVFGQGLALRGPAGSMIKAINSFIYYQQHILFSFTMNIVFLGLSTIFQYYVFMTLLGAHICCVITIFGMLVWHKYCLKVFNGFKFANETINWTKRDDDIIEVKDSTGDVDDDPTHNMERGQSGASRSQMTHGVGGPGMRNRDHKKEASWRRKIFSKFIYGGESSSGGGGHGHGGAEDYDVEGNVSNPMGGANSSAYRRSSNTRPDDGFFDNILFHGTVDMRSFVSTGAGAGVGGGSMIPSSASTGASSTSYPQQWTRRYVIVLGSKMLMIYSSRGAYESNPSTALCKVFKSPVDVVEDYCPPVAVQSDDNREAKNIVLTAVAGGASDPSARRTSSATSSSELTANQSKGVELRFFTVDDSNTCFAVLQKLHHERARGGAGAVPTSGASALRL